MLLESAPRVTLSNTIQLLDASGRPVHYAGYVLSWPANTVNTYSPNGLLTEWPGTMDLATRSALSIYRLASNTIIIKRHYQETAHARISKLSVIIVTRRLGFKVPELVP